MNFCGGQIDQQIIESTGPSASSSKLAFCGPCVKSMSEEEVIIGVYTPEVVGIPLTEALDVIEQTVGDIDEQEEQVAARLPVEAIDVATPLNPRTMKTLLDSHNCSPSPCLLNPIPNDLEVSKSSLLCPALDTSSEPHLEGLLERVKDGFALTLNGEPVLLYLHDDHNRLCLSNSSKQEKKEKETVDFWMELPLSNICKLEKVPGSTTAFSIVLRQSRKPVTYTLNAASPLEREVLVSTLLVILDRARSSSLQMRQTKSAAIDDEVDFVPLVKGTRYQPIPCSPSLEERPIPCSPSLEEEQTQLSPKKRTEIILGQLSTETSLAKKPTDDEGPLQLMDEIPAPSASSSLVAGGWCTDDICALALNDIADTCSGIFALKRAESSGCHPIGEEQRKIIEDYISSALGAPTAMFSYLTDGEVWDEAVMTSSESSLRGCTRIQNRASLLNAQAARLRNLRSEMTFANALKQSKLHHIKTAHSFDDAHLYDDKSARLLEAVGKFHTSALLRSIVGRMMLFQTPDESENEEVLYYDSDPEDSRPRTLKQGPRRVAADWLNRESGEQHNNPALGRAGLERITSRRRISRKLDEESIVEIVQAMNNERLTLLWHPTQSKDAPNLAPVCIKLWIETGVYLMDGTFVLPKLTWMKGSGEQKSQKLYTLDLLDICRIRSTERVDRRQHPFAVPAKSFLIETQSMKLLLEAQSSDERDRIVFALKLLVARLASLLMLRDVRAAEEFFGAISGSVPGEAPEWARK